MRGPQKVHLSTGFSSFTEDIAPKSSTTLLSVDELYMGYKETFEKMIKDGDELLKPLEMIVDACLFGRLNTCAIPLFFDLFDHCGTDCELFRNLRASGVNQPVTVKLIERYGSSCFAPLDWLSTKHYRSKTLADKYRRRTTQKAPT